MNWTEFIDVSRICDLVHFGAHFLFIWKIAFCALGDLQKTTPTYSSIYITFDIEPLRMLICASRICIKYCTLYRMQNVLQMITYTQYFSIMSWNIILLCWPRNMLCPWGAWRPWNDGVEKNWLWRFSLRIKFRPHNTGKPHIILEAPEATANFIIEKKCNA